MVIRWCFILEALLQHYHLGLRWRGETSNSRQGNDLVKIELKTPKDFVVLIGFIGLVGLLIYGIGQTLYFLIYVLGYHLFFQTMLMEIGKLGSGQIPFLSTVFEIVSLTFSHFQDGNWIIGALGLLLIFIVLVGIPSLCVILFIIVRGLIGYFWRVFSNLF